MELEYQNGRLSFNFQDALESLCADEKRDLIEALSCDAEVVTFVAQQIIDKWTESGYYSGVSCVANHTAYHGLGKAWRDVAKASGEVAKREIERLEEALRHQVKQTETAWAEYHKLIRERTF